MSKQNVAIALIWILLACVGRADERPNIVLLMGDDHGWSETGYNGHRHVKTPVLDEMAKTGLRMDRFYAAHPTCSPTRGSVLTGRHPNRYGTFHPGWSIRPNEITIARLLAQQGYLCAHFGKWHLGPVKADSPTNPRAMGFHEFVSHDNFYEMDPPMSRNGGPPEILPGEGSEATIRETIKFIDKSKQQKKPFFAVVWFGSPHEPYSGLDKDLSLYDDLPNIYNDRQVKLTSMTTGRPTKRPLGDVLRERYAEITAMDRSIGSLRNHLQEKGLRQNTIVWYCGDNGNPPSSGRVSTPLRGQKAQMYEGGIRVPAVVEWPAKIKPAMTSKVSASTSDMLPTLCELGKTQAPKRPLDGISLASLFSNQMQKRPTPICFWRYDSKRLDDLKLKPFIDPALQEGTTPLVKFMAGKRTRSFKNFHHPPLVEADYRGARTIVDNNYKLVVSDAQGAESIELFDLEKDPAESQNLVDTQPEVAKKLSQQLRDWQASVLESLTGADYE